LADGDRRQRNRETRAVMRLRFAAHAGREDRQARNKRVVVQRPDRREWAASWRALFLGGKRMLEDGKGEAVNITPDEYIEIQRKAVESVTEIKGLKPIECGVKGYVWRDAATARAHGKLALNLAYHRSELDLAFDEEEIAADEAFPKAMKQISDHIENEVRRAFGDFLQEFARMAARIRK
jgi:hypothetical protein